MRDAPEPSASVFAQPTPHGFWSSNNSFGFELVMEPKGDARQRVLKLPEWGEPAPWTVALGIDYSDAEWPPGGDRGFEVVADIAFGAGGATQNVQMDWIQGTTFCAPMNALSVDASFSFPSAEGGALPKDLTLRVLVGRGGSHAGKRPTKMAPQLDGSAAMLLSDDTLVDPPVRIPAFGKRLFLVPETRGDYVAFTNGNNFVRFFGAPDVAGSAIAVGTFLVDQSALLEGVLVPPFAKYATLENVGGLGGGALVLFNFELEL